MEFNLRKIEFGGKIKNQVIYYPASMLLSDDKNVLKFNGLQRYSKTGDFIAGVFCTIAKMKRIIKYIK